MSITTLIGATCSFIMPGLGQLFYGKFGWAMIWVIMAMFTGPLANVLAAVHCVFIGIRSSRSSK